MTYDRYLLGGIPSPTLSGLSAIGRVETIAQLKALATVTFINGLTVEVLGYFAAGDGGGGMFWWDSSSVASDNTGTILAPNAGGTGRWKRLFSGAYSVKWFGAVGDGITNDTTAIQTTINTALPGETVFFPAGNYLVSSSISIANSGQSRGVHLLGNSNADITSSARSRIFGSINGPILKTGTTGSAPAGSFRKLNIENTHATGIGLQLQKFVGCVVDNCFIKAWRGIICPDSTFALGISNVIVRPVSAWVSGSIGIHCTGQTTLTNVDFQSYETAMSLGGVGVSVRGARIEVCVVALALGYDHVAAASRTLEGAQISGIQCEGNDYELYFAGARGCTFSGISTQGTAQAPAGTPQFGIYVDGPMQDLEFNGIWFGGSTPYVAGLKTPGTSTVENVVFVGCQLQSGVFHANTPSTKFRFIASVPFGTTHVVDTPAQITSNQTDYGSGSAMYYADTWRLSSDASRTIHGINNVGDAARTLRLLNVGAQNIVLANQSATEGTATNRIITGTGADATIAPDDAAELEYDRTTGRWRVLNTY